MREAERLLLLLTERLPPTEGRRHGLLIIDGKLKLHLSRGDQWQIMSFDEGDYEKSTDALVDEILQALPAIP